MTMRAAASVRPSTLRLASLLALACLATGCADLNKEEKYLITVHAQGAPEDNPKSIFREVVGGQSTIFQLSPQFSQVNIAACHPFDSPDGNGKGVTLKLDFRGASALEILTRSRQGEILITKINGKTVDFVTIDRPVLDGLFTIWGGVPEDVIKEIEKSHPHISQSRSAGAGVDMTPTTKKEKKVALERARREKSARTDRAKKPGWFSKDRKPAVREELPPAPTTSQIPIEGPAAGPQAPPTPQGPQPPAPPQVQPPLPVNPPLPQQ